MLQKGIEALAWLFIGAFKETRSGLHNLISGAIVAVVFTIVIWLGATV
jgi:hypothetical protein